MEKLDTLLETLKKRRDAVMERGVRLVDTTRDRGLDTLGSIRSGALDWHETLSARRSELEQRGPKWLGFTKGLQLVVIDRFDRALVSFGDRVRSEIQRLSQLELASSPSPTTKIEAAAAKPSTKDGARRVSAKAPSARAAKSATAKAQTAKAQTAKAQGASAEAKAPTTKAKAKKAKPAKAKGTKAKAKAASATEPSSNRSSTTRRLMMPIADYDSLNAKEIVGELSGLSTAQCQTLFEHESANKNRQTVLKALAARLDS